MTCFHTFAVGWAAILSACAAWGLENACHEPAASRTAPAARASASAPAQTPPAAHQSEPARRSSHNDFDSLRAMTFNIRYNNPRDGENAWPKRREMVASMIRLHGADVAGLQEVQPVQAKVLQELLSGWQWIGLDIRDPKGDAERVPIVYRPERLNRLDEGHFWLSQTPDAAESRGWDAAMPRLCVWGKFLDRRSGQTLFVFNTHFDHLGKEARLESAKLVKSKVAAIAGQSPAIVLGDMNCRDSEPPYAELASVNASGGVSLRDALHASRHPHHGPTSTFHAFGRLPSDRKDDRRIDYIFVTPSVKVLQHAILTDRWNDGRWPSDHLPVLAEVVNTSPRL